MPSEVTSKQLQDAMREARCHGELAEVMQWPAMAIALRNTAEAMRRPAQPPRALPGKVLDFKRACAGDRD